MREDIAARLGLAAADAGAWKAARRMTAMISRSAQGAKARTGNALLLETRMARWAEDEPAVLNALSRARLMDPAVALKATLILADDVLRSGKLRRAGIDGLIADLGILARLRRDTADGDRAADRSEQSPVDDEPADGIAEPTTTSTTTIRR